MSYLDRINWNRLIIAFVSATLLNLFPIYFLNDLKINFDTIHHGHVEISTKKEKQTIEDDIHEKNLQLSKTFQIQPDLEEHLFDFEFPNQEEVIAKSENFDRSSNLIKKSPLLKEQEILSQTCLKGEIFSDNISIEEDAFCLKVGLPKGISNESYEIDTNVGVTELANFDPFELEQAGILGEFNDNPSDFSNGHLASTEDFDLDLEYAPQKNHDGYVFKISLSPKEDTEFQRIKHNVTFILDRSSSIKRNRFEISKQAVIEALTLLTPGDSFNIIVFDKKIVSLSLQNLSYNSRNLLKAKEFLRKQQSGGILATTELYKSLKSIIPKRVAKNEVNTAILLSDGDTYLLPKKQRILIQEWIKDNKGKISLYCIAMRNHDNIALLDVLSTFNQGSIYTANDIYDIPKTTQFLIKEIKRPIGKDILLTAVPKYDNNHIEIGLTYAKTPNLYADKKYTFYGSINNLEDFYLFFQGKCYDKKINIRQYVDFKKGKLVKDPWIARMWAKEEANALYEKYLSFGREEDLEKAKKILLAHRLPIAFK